MVKSVNFIMLKNLHPQTTPHTSTLGILVKRDKNQTAYISDNKNDTRWELKPPHSYKCKRCLSTSLIKRLPLKPEISPSDI